MNVKLYKRRENTDSFKPNNNSLNVNNLEFNTQGKIKEKFITINTNSIPFPKENRIKELEISLKPNNIIRKISPRNDKPYLKPKFQLKNRNSFCIKNKATKNNDKTEFKTKDVLSDINLNLFKIYYDENIKKLKIIKDKNINKENEQKDNDKDNYSNYKTNIKIDKNNYKNDLSSSKNTKSKKGKNISDMKYLYPDTPTQSTTTENKSDTKSLKTQTKKGTTNSKRQSNIKKKNEINEKVKKVKKNIHYDKLSNFLQKKKQFKKIDKTYKEMYNGNKKLNNNEMKSFEKTLNKKKTGINKDILIKKINFNNLEKESFNESIKKKFISHKNNLSLNMTFEPEIIKNIFYKKNNNVNNKNNNIKKLYISSVKTRNIQDLKNNNLNNLDNIQSCKNAQRNTIQFPDNYLFNFFRGRKKDLLRNNSHGNGNQNLSNNNSNNISRESSFFDKQNLSFNNNLFKHNTLNFIKEKNENILNKTKNILKLNESKKVFTNKNSQRYLILDNYESNFDRYPKRIIQQSHKNFKEKIINIPNISYFMNSKSMKETEKKSLLENKFNRNKRPCSLYFNKNFIGKEKCNITLNDYYNNAVYKNNNLTINNINISPNNIGYNNKHFGGMNKNFSVVGNKKEIDINNNINKLSKFNFNLKKFISLNENNSSQNFCKDINQRTIDNNNIFKFNRNKLNFQHSHNTSMNFIPSFLSLNNKNNE